MVSSQPQEISSNNNTNGHHNKANSQHNKANVQSTKAKTNSHHNKTNSNGQSKSTSVGGSRKGSRKRKRTCKMVKTGGRRSVGIIGSAITAALVPFGLFAAQKEVQKNTTTSSMYKKKTKKRKNNRSKKYRKYKK